MTHSRSRSPWRTPTAAGRPESIAIAPKPIKSAQAVDSWWTKYATPETPFEDFQAAASARDVEMSATSHAWRSLKMGST